MYSATVYIGTVPVTVTADGLNGLADALESLGVSETVITHLRNAGKPVRRKRD